MVNKKFLLQTAGILFVFGLFFLSASTASAASLNAPTVQKLINTERAKANVPVLHINSKLQTGAQLKAQDLARNNYFSHTSPKGKTPWYWFTAVGYSYAIAGENLAIQYSDPNQLVAAWMKSAGHRANILNKNFTETGIGVVNKTIGKSQVTYIVQFFGKPKATSKLYPSKKSPTRTPAYISKRRGS